MSTTRLASVLRVRRIQERRATAALAISQHAHRQAVAREAAARLAVRERAHRQLGISTVATIAAERNVVESGLAAIDRRLTARRRTGEQLAERTDEWAIAARRVDALERVDERLAAIAAAEADRRERAEIDDLVITRHRKAATR